MENVLLLSKPFCYIMTKIYCGIEIKNYIIDLLGLCTVVGIWYVMGLECFELLSHFFFLPRYVDDIYQDYHRKVGKTPRYPHDQSSSLT